jgi:hypothetical protein
VYSLSPSRQFCVLVESGLLENVTWFKVPSKNIKSESGAERLGLVSMHAGEVRGAVLDLFGTLSSL